MGSVTQILKKGKIAEAITKAGKKLAGSIQDFMVRCHYKITDDIRRLFNQAYSPQLEGQVTEEVLLSDLKQKREPTYISHSQILIQICRQTMISSLIACPLQAFVTRLRLRHPVFQERALQSKMLF